MFTGLLPGATRTLDRLALAFDFSDEAMLAKHARLFSRVGLVKVGLEAISAIGLQTCRDAIEAAGGTVLVDLKMKDIPNTVERAVEALARQGYFAVTITGDASEEMLKAAVSAAKKVQQETGHLILLIAVTRLTSDTHLTDEDMVNIAKKAKGCGFTAVVCAAGDLSLLQADPDTQDLLTLVPAIRLADGEVHDQARPSTPGNAKAAGADMLVGGRAIFESDDPSAVIDEFERQMT